MTWPFLAGEKPHAEKLGEGAAEYTPQLLGASQNPTLGSGGEASGWWVRLGPNVVLGGARFLWGGSGRNAGSGTYSITLPLEFNTSLMDAHTTPGYGMLIGTGYVRDHDTGNQCMIVAPQLDSPTTFRLARHGFTSAVSSSNTADGWDQGDAISTVFLGVVVDGATPLSLESLAMSLPDMFSAGLLPGAVHEAVAELATPTAED